MKIEFKQKKKRNLKYKLYFAIKQMADCPIDCTSFFKMLGEDLHRGHHF